MALIYIVEDDQNIREIESFALKNSGYQVQGFECAKDFYHQLAEKTPDQYFKKVSEEDASPWKCGYRRGTVSGCAGEDLCMDGSDIVTAWTFWHSDDLFYYDSWIGRSCYRSFSAGKPLKH